MSRSSRQRKQKSFPAESASESFFPLLIYSLRSFFNTFAGFKKKFRVNFGTPHFVSEGFDADHETTNKSSTDVYFFVFFSPVFV